MFPRMISLAKYSVFHAFLILAPKPIVSVLFVAAISNVALLIVKAQVTSISSPTLPQLN